MFKHEFEYDMDCFWQNVQNESCSFMSLYYAFKISAYLVKYNSRYEPVSALYSVLDRLFCNYYFMGILDDSENEFNMKVVDNLLN